MCNLFEKGMYKKTTIIIHVLHHIYIYTFCNLTNFYNVMHRRISYPQLYTCICIRYGSETKSLFAFVNNF